MVFPLLTLVVQRDGPRLVPLDVPPAWEAAPPGRLLDLADLDGLLRLRREGEGALAADDPLLAELRHAGLVGAAGVDGELNGNGLGPATEASATSEAAPFVPADEPVLLHVPFTVRVDRAGFEVVDHDGRTLVVLTAAELLASCALASPTTVAAAVDAARAALGDRAPDAASLQRVAAGLRRAGLLTAPDPDTEGVTHYELEVRRSIRAALALRERVTTSNKAADDAERDRVGTGGRARTPVVGVQVAGNTPPLSTGMVLAFARAWNGGVLEDTYDLHPRWVTRLEDVSPSAEPRLYLFTNYLWSHEQNLALARRIKEASPAAITVFGGPDCPAGAEDAARYFAAHPQVDIAVRGEGEVTAAEVLDALAPSVRTGAPDLDALADVPGVVFRRPDGAILRTDDRPRIEDLDTVPSPYLTGVFDDFGATRQMGMAILETNRGCPYGCTFCDWGSATNSRIRRFDLDRVFQELDWMAEHEVPNVFVADANFGIFPRDVEIARYFVELKQRHGFPKKFTSNYAKNTVKHLREIVEILAEGGILSEGLLSLQSMDDDTLLSIRRSNIKLEKYEALASEFRTADLPLYVDLMMGLPGQTVGSLRADFQQCVDREVNAKCHQTELLVNSPMNDPEYRAEHRIETSRPPGPTGSGTRGDPAYVVATSTFDRDDYQQMHLMRRFYLLAENFGVLRHVMRFTRREAGIPEVDLLERMRANAAAEPARWPHLALTIAAVPTTMLPPASWRPLIDEVGRYLTTEVGIQAGPDLDTVLAVQHALLPATGRTFPQTLELPHDYATWYRSVLAAKADGHLHDWEQHVGRLADLPPAAMEVDDPDGICERVIGQLTAISAYSDWELRSPVARATSHHYRA